MKTADCAAAFRTADELFFEKSDIQGSLAQIRLSLRDCRDAALIPGLRIMLGLAYLRLGNVERLSDELMAALMTAPGHLEKNVEQILVGAISYFRILNEEMKKNNMTLPRLPDDATVLERVDARFREWTSRSGYEFRIDAPSV